MLITILITMLISMLSNITMAMRITLPTVPSHA